MFFCMSLSLLQTSAGPWQLLWRGHCFACGPCEHWGKGAMGTSRGFGVAMHPPQSPPAQTVFFQGAPHQAVEQTILGQGGRPWWRPPPPRHGLVHRPRLRTAPPRHRFPPHLQIAALLHRVDGEPLTPRRRQARQSALRGGHWRSVANPTRVGRVPVIVPCTGWGQQPKRRGRDIHGSDMDSRQP